MHKNFDLHEEESTLEEKHSHINKLKEWTQIQMELKNKVSLVSSFKKPISLIAGMDISFSTTHDSFAIASLIVLDYNTMDLVYEVSESCYMTEPYITGYLAFREVDILCRLWRHMQEDIRHNCLDTAKDSKSTIDSNDDKNNSGVKLDDEEQNHQSMRDHSIEFVDLAQMNVVNRRKLIGNIMNDKCFNLTNRRKCKLKNEPDVVLLDGNGIHHHYGFGLACHFGVLMDVPTIGVAKKFLHVDGLTRENQKDLQEHLNTKDYVIVQSPKTNEEISALVRGKSAKNPVFISPGHRVSMEDTISIVQHCLKYKNPEPVRIADLYSRKLIRIWDKENQKMHKKSI